MYNNKTLVNPKKPSLKKTIGLITVYTFLIGYLLIVLYPLFWMVISSFKDTSEIFRSVWALPEKWLFQNFIDAWNNGIAEYFVNSIIVTSVSVILTVFLGALGAFGLSRFKFRGQNILLIVTMGSLMVSPQISLIPLYELMQSFGLYDSLWALILPYIAYRLPFTLLLIRGFFLSIPKDYEEAAFIDGYNIYQVFFYLFIPMSLPILCTAAIMSAYFSWNEFLFAIVFINSDSLRTIPAGLLQFRGVLETNWGVLLAGLTISAIPIISLFLFMQKYFLRGLAGGGVKG